MADRALTDDQRAALLEKQLSDWPRIVQAAETPEQAIELLTDAVRQTVKNGLFRPDIYGVGAGDLSIDEGWLIVCQTGCGPTSSANADLIAHAPADIAALLAEVERLTTDNERLRTALHDTMRVNAMEDSHG